MRIIWTYSAVIIRALPLILTTFQLRWDSLIVVIWRFLVIWSDSGLGLILSLIGGKHWSFLIIRLLISCSSEIAIGIGQWVPIVVILFWIWRQHFLSFSMRVIIGTINTGNIDCDVSPLNVAYFGEITSSITPLSLVDFVHGVDDWHHAINWRALHKIVIAVLDYFWRAIRVYQQSLNRLKINLL